MGEVYRARDTHARSRRRDQGPAPRIRAIPNGSRASNAKRALLASLNHPNIAAIYGVEDRRRPAALVLELVEGETLGGSHRGAADSRSTRRSAFARQIADALDAAHEAGIVHRDLKPANIKVTPDGTRQGARLRPGQGDRGRRRESRGRFADARRRQRARRRHGVILGTAAYMSPEQARGKAVDKRTDIWAFGCVLFEMLTGARAFDGDTISDVIAAILEREPDWRRCRRRRRRAFGGCCAAVSRKIRSAACATSRTCELELDAAARPRSPRRERSPRLCWPRRSRSPRCRRRWPASRYRPAGSPAAAPIEFAFSPPPGNSSAGPRRGVSRWPQHRISARAINKQATSLCVRSLDSDRPPARRHGRHHALPLVAG